MPDELAERRARRGKPKPPPAIPTTRPTATKAYRSDHVYPKAITRALDIRGLEGPGVDASLGVPEPTVDMWEDGTLEPTPAQVKRLSRLTGFPVSYFYTEPVDRVGPVIMCGPSGCETYDPAAPDLEPQPRLL